MSEPGLLVGRKIHQPSAGFPRRFLTGLGNAKSISDSGMSRAYILACLDRAGHVELGRKAVKEPAALAPLTGLAPKWAAAREELRRAAGRLLVAGIRRTALVGSGQTFVRRCHCREISPGLARPRSRHRLRPTDMPRGRRPEAALAGSFRTPVGHKKQDDAQGLEHLCNKLRLLTDWARPKRFELLTPRS
jgi:hypothetical protein